MKPFPLICVNISQNRVNIQNKMAITDLAKDKILESLQLRQLIAIAMGVGERTVQNWAYNNSKKLKTPTVISIIQGETGLKKSEIVSPESIASDPGDEVEHITN
jgi:hypothetical protein